MKTLYFQLFLFGMLHLICPNKTSAETLCTVNESRTIPTTTIWTDFKKVTGGIKKTLDKYRLLGKGKAISRGGKVAAIVFLALGAAVFGLFGLVILAGAIEGWYFWGTSFALILLLFSIICLTLCILCIRGISKTAKKLHRMKTGELAPEEKFPQRPPSKKLDDKPE